MKAELVAQYLTALKEKRKLTYEAIAEISERSESTVKNLCLGKSEDPRIDTVAPVVYALGGSMDEMLNPGKTKDDLKEVSIASLKEIYEHQIAEMNKINEAHINNIRAHYEQHRQDYKENVEKRFSDKLELLQAKDEYAKALKIVILALGISLGVCLLILIGLLIAEVMNPNLGWFRY